MAEALGWIGDLINLAIKLIPHLEVIKKTHGGIKFVRGWKIKVLHPGIHWYWPITSEITTTPVVRQTLQLAGQTLTCADHLSIYISTVIVYRIHDVEAALVGTWEFDETIEDITQKCTTHAVAEYDRESLFENLDDFISELSDQITSQLTLYGVTLLECGVVDLAPTKVYRFVTG